MKTLGEAIFSDIESNTYLNKIYSNILQQYTLFLFGKDKSTNTIPIKDALRFADLLSKSTDKEKRDKHYNLSQEIVSLLYTLDEKNEIIQYVQGSVLTNIQNFKGLSHCNSKYVATSIFEEAYIETVKANLQIPGDDGKYFFENQKDILDKIQKPSFSYSGPTSMGKSFVMRMFIKHQISNDIKENYVILVPTRALINEVSINILNDLKNMLREKDYHVITSSGELEYLKSENYICVLTPERLLYLLLEFPDFPIQYLFVDEAHKISSKDNRSPYYYKVIDLIDRRKDNTHVIFSSPYVPNPEIYLQLLASRGSEQTNAVAYKFNPVSQIKYIIDLKEKQISIQNNLDQSFINLDNSLLDNVSDLLSLLHTLGKNKQNIVYCSSRGKTVEYARNYAVSLDDVITDSRLEELINEIAEEIHRSYYLIEVLRKGVAYHIGYLPTGIRRQIEELYKDGVIKTLFCTSTLVEGVNLPADNLFVTSYRRGNVSMTPIDFNNLIGRVGRIEFNLYGNVFLVVQDSAKKSNYENYLKKEVNNQNLSLVTEITTDEKKGIVNALSNEDPKALMNIISDKTDKFRLVNGFSQILRWDIIHDNNSYVRNQFQYELTEDALKKIQLYQYKDFINDDITISPDQSWRLSNAIKEGLRYPNLESNNKRNYDNILKFLEELYDVFKWDIYDAKYLGKKNSLKKYAVIINQWIHGIGLNQIIHSDLKYRHNNKGKVRINGKYEDYTGSKDQINYIISDILEIIDEIILFRFVNYFRKFSKEYVKIFGEDSLKPDWYDFVEYGTIDEEVIYLQKHGITRETAKYLRDYDLKYLTTDKEGALRIFKSTLQYAKKSVRDELSDVYYNIPTLFTQ